MNTNCILILLSYLLLAVLIFAAIQSGEARRRPKESYDDDDVGDRGDLDDHDQGLSDCDSNYRTNKNSRPTAGQRITWGRRTQIGEFPFTVRIEYGNETNHCTGSIIDDRVVLTSAHCVTRPYKEAGGQWGVVDPRLMRIVAGDWQTDFEEDRQVYYKVDQLLAHKYFKPAQWYSENDIALIKTIESIQITPGVNNLGKVDRISLPPKDGLAKIPGGMVTVAGWGNTNQKRKEEAFYPSHLMAYDTKLQRCWHPYVPITTQYICTRVEPVTEGERGPCYGDTGGPLFVQPPPDKAGRPQRPIQYGITSFIPGGVCAKVQGFYTNLTRYVPWIAKTLVKPVPYLVLSRKRGE